MFKLSRKYRNISITLLFVLLTQACALAGLTAPSALPTARDVAPTATQERSAPLATSTPTAGIPTATEIIPTSTPYLPKVILSVVKGNIFIRRGPDMAFNPTGVLYKDTSVKVIARDVLSKWVQIEIPNSDKTGWVSIQTQYSEIRGDIQYLPEYTPTEWPVPAYVRNCTHHQMYVLPVEILLPSSYRSPDNEAWIYPGSYTVIDLDVSGEPTVAEITVKEGSEIEIRDDGSGEHRKCP